jgi:hypothetical protein
VHDPGERVARLVGFVPALDAGELGQARAALADDRHALAHVGERLERILDERPAGELGSRLRAAPEPASFTTGKHRTDHSGRAYP